MLQLTSTALAPSQAKRMQKRVFLYVRRDETANEKEKGRQRWRAKVDKERRQGKRKRMCVCDQGETRILQRYTR